MSSNFDPRVIKILGGVFYANRRECPDLDLGPDSGEEVACEEIGELISIAFRVVIGIK